MTLTTRSVPLRNQDVEALWDQSLISKEPPLTPFSLHFKPPTRERNSNDASLLQAKNKSTDRSPGEGIPSSGDLLLRREVASVEARQIVSRSRESCYTTAVSIGRKVVDIQGSNAKFRS